MNQIQMRNPARPIRVFVVDDDQTVRSATQERLNLLAGIRCVGVAEDGEAALRLIPGINPDVVLMDIRLLDISGIECMRRLRSELPMLRFVMFTGYPEPELVVGSFRAGASGMLTKPHSIEELEKAVRDTCADMLYLSLPAANAMVSVLQRKWVNGDGAVPLSAREDHVMQCLIAGKWNKEIADTLGIGEGSVHTYLQRIYAKLGVHSRGEAVQKYLGIKPG